jgi:hypothetical protein
VVATRDQTLIRSSPQASPWHGALTQQHFKDYIAKRRDGVVEGCRSLTNDDVPTKGVGTVAGKASGWDLHVRPMIRDAPQHLSKEGNGPT